MSRFQFSKCCLQRHSPITNYAFCTMCYAPTLFIMQGIPSRTFWLKSNPQGQKMDLLLLLLYSFPVMAPEEELVDHQMLALAHYVASLYLFLLCIFTSILATMIHVATIFHLPPQGLQQTWCCSTGTRETVRSSKQGTNR
jgi:hypothetical protein